MKGNFKYMELFYHKTFDEIESKIGVKETKARKIWQRVQDLIEEKDLSFLLAVLE